MMSVLDIAIEEAMTTELLPPLQAIFTVDLEQRRL